MNAKRFAVLLSACWSLIAASTATATTTNLVDGCYVCEGKFIGVDTNATRIVFPSGMTEIPRLCCLGMECLKEVQFPNTVTNIGEAAFGNCKGLTEVRMPEGLRRIGQKEAAVFYGTTWVGDTEYIFVTGYQSPAGAFEGCVNLAVVSLPSTLSFIGYRSFAKCKALSSITIPASVVSILPGAFAECISLKDISLCEGLRDLGCQWGPIVYETQYVGGEGYLIPTFPETVCAGSVADGVFYRCTHLQAVVVPKSVSYMGDFAFCGCNALSSIRFGGDEPCFCEIGSWSRSVRPTDLFRGTPYELCIEVEKTADGWLEELTLALPYRWNGRPIVYRGEIPVPAQRMSEDDEYALRRQFESVVCVLDVTGASISDKSKLQYLYWGMRQVESCPALIEQFCELLECVGGCLSASQQEEIADWTLAMYERQAKLVHDDPTPGSSAGGASVSASLVVTNVIVHCVVNSIVPELAVPFTDETGFVSVVTEVKSSGAVAVPEAWAKNYPSFANRFGYDFAKSLLKLSGKRDAAGNALCVWQDYVAGTDPTDESDVFTASVTMVGGKPVVSWTPELPAEQAALRKYTTYGKVRLQDAEWSIVNGDEANYNFFKVTVEMK